MAQSEGATPAVRSVPERPSGWQRRQDAGSFGCDTVLSNGVYCAVLPGQMSPVIAIRVGDAVTHMV
jgi:hypothetical protein